jgi:hypothetical protein
MIFLAINVLAKSYSNDSLSKPIKPSDTVYLKFIQNDSSIRKQSFIKENAVPVVSVLSAIGAFIGVFLQVRANNKAKERELQDRRHYEIIKTYSELISAIDLDIIEVRDNLAKKNEPTMLFFQKKVILLSLLRKNTNKDISTFATELDKYKNENIDTKDKALKWIASFSDKFYKLISEL